MDGTGSSNMTNNEMKSKFVHRRVLVLLEAKRVRWRSNQRPVHACMSRVLLCRQGEGGGREKRTTMTSVRGIPMATVVTCTCLPPAHRRQCTIPTRPHNATGGTNGTGLVPCAPWKEMPLGFSMGIILISVNLAGITSVRLTQV